MLKLIPNAPKALQQNSSGNHKEEHTPPNNFSPASLLSHFQELSKNLYVFSFHDIHHELSCEITLELKNNFALTEKDGHEDSHFVPVLSGDFPTIDLQRLQCKVPWDDYLHVLLVIRFHLKILEQLLLFCQEKDVLNLTLTFEEANLDYMEVFRHFFIAEAQVLTATGEQTKVLIPANEETYEELFQFMERLAHDFRQNLWRDQKINPAFRQYLKYLSLPEF